MSRNEVRSHDTDIIEDRTRENYPDTFSFRAFPEQLDCLRRGDLEGLMATFTDDIHDYYRNAILDHAMLPLLFAHLCGCCLMLSYEGGLPLSRAAAISTKYMNMCQDITSVEDFVARLQEMQTEFTGEVAFATRISSGSHTVDLCKHYIHEHANEKISLDALAEASGYSLSRLQHIFRQFTGMSLTAYIRKEKIEKACLLLRYSDESSSAISQKLSYCSQSYFIRQFQEETGMTPARYRRNAKKTDLKNTQAKT